MSTELTLKQKNIIKAYQLGIINFFQYLELMRGE